MIDENVLNKTATSSRQQWVLFMKKFFSILTFGILLLPMMQMCGNGCAGVPKSAEEVNDVTTTAKEKSIFDDDFVIVLSGYELVKISALAPFEILNPKNKEEFTIKDYLNNLYMFLFLPFSIISVLLIIFSFLKKYNKAFLTLSVVNLIILITFFVSFITTETAELKDVKYGFYLLTLNSILIIISSVLQRKSKKRRTDRGELITDEELQKEIETW